MARKMEDEYDQGQILGHYLNSVYFGRGAYGIEAAAQAYFGKTADRRRPPERDHRRRGGGARRDDQAAGARPGDATGLRPGQQPAGGPGPVATTRSATCSSRSWMQRLPAGIDAAAEYPETVKPFDPTSAPPRGRRQAGGKIVKPRAARAHAHDRASSDGEAARRAVSRSRPRSTRGCRRRPRRRRSAASKESPLNSRPRPTGRPLVAIDPETGRVLGLLRRRQAARLRTTPAELRRRRQGFIGGGQSAGLDVQDLHAGRGAEATGISFDTTGTATMKKVERRRQDQQLRP